MYLGLYKDIICLLFVCKININKYGTDQFNMHYTMKHSELVL